MAWFVSQHMAYFREAFMGCWIECVLFGAWVEYSVDVCYIHLMSDIN